MSTPIGDAFVRIHPNMATFESETLAGVKKTFRRAAEVAGLAYGAKASFDFVKSAVNDAASVQKSQELIRTEFGKSGNQIKKWSEDAGIHLGIAAHESDSVAARFGILFKNMGVGQKQASDMTLNMEKLGGSIAAIRGIDPSTVLERLPIALAGNIRGLKQLGIAIDAQAVKETALQLGFGKTVNASEKSRIATDKLAIARAQEANALQKYGPLSTQYVAAHDAVAVAQGKVNAGVKQTLASLTPAQRAMVIYTIATKNLGSFQQQAAAHSNDLANVQRRLSAEWDKARETLGTDLMPLATRYTNELAKWIDRMDKSGKLQRDLNGVVSHAATVVKLLATMISNLVAGFKDLGTFVGGTTNLVKLFVAAWAGFKVAQLLVALQLLATRIAAVGTAASVAAGEAGVAGLLGKLSLLRQGIATPFIIAIGLSYFVSKYGAKNVLQSFNPFGDGTLGPGVTPFPGGESSNANQSAYSRAAMKRYQQLYGTHGPGGAHGGGGHLFGSALTGEDPTLVSGLQALAGAGYSVDVKSAFRTFKQQVALYARYVKSGFNKKYIAAKPGTSDHERGLAADVMINGKAAATYGAAFLARFGLVAPLGMGDAVHLTTLGGLGQQSGSTGSTDTTGGGLGGGGLHVGTVIAKMTSAQIEAAKRSLNTTFTSIKAEASKLGTGLTKKISSDMAAARKEIGGVSNESTISQARAALSKLRAEVSAHLQLLRQKITLTNTFEGLQRQAKKLGDDTTPWITKAMSSIRAQIDKAVTPQQVANVRNRMNAIKTAIQTQVTIIKQQAQEMQNKFDTAFSQIGSSADNAFDRATTKMLKTLHTLVTVGGTSFDFGGANAKTPAEKALETLTSSHNAAVDAKTLSDAQLNLVQAQKALADLMTPTQLAVDSATDSYNSIVARIAVAQEKLTSMQSGGVVDALQVAKLQVQLSQETQKLASMNGNPTAYQSSAVDMQKALVAGLKDALATAQSPLSTYTAAQIALQQSTIDSLSTNAEQARQKLNLLQSPTGDDITQAKQAVIDAQASVDDSLYNAKQNALQAQANLERDAADQALQDAQDSFSQQRDLLKQQMDERVAAIRQGMLDGTIATSAGMDQLKAVFSDPQFGIDVQNSGVVIAGALYQGLSDGLVPVMKLLDDLAAKMKKVGLLPGGNTPPPATSGKVPVSGLMYSAANPNLTPQQLADALRMANTDVVDAIKDQTDTVTKASGVSIYTSSQLKIAQAAMR